MAAQPLFSRQSGFGPLARMLAELEGEPAVERLTRLEGVAFEPGAPLRPLPFVSMSRVFERAARLTGDDLLGFRVGRAMRYDGFGPMVYFAQSAPTLDRAIGRTGVLAPLQSNAVGLPLIVRGDTAIWRLAYRRSVLALHQQHALHVLPAMVDGLKYFLGFELDGLEVEVPFLNRMTAAALEDELGLPVRPGASHYALVFPAAWLGMKRQAALAPRVTLSDVYRHYNPHLPRTTRDAIWNVLPPLLANGRAQLDDVARHLGMSRRKVQSDLTTEGQVFRDLLREARTTRAMELMRETRATLAQIALAVGYSDQAHFHRAFASVTGMAPGQWRAAMAARAAPEG